MNTKKSQFLLAVRIIAPNDSLILNLAECVSEETLPEYPGAAALRFVATVSRLCEERPAATFPAPGFKASAGACRRRFHPMAPAPLRHRCHVA